MSESEWIHSAHLQGPEQKIDVLIHEVHVPIKETKALSDDLLLLDPCRLKADR